MTMNGKNGKKLNKSILKSKTIVLLDSITDFEKYQKIDESLKFEIITFDYNLHKILKSKNISHKISDQFFVHDFNQIQELTRKLSNWYNELDICNYVKYKNHNLGELFYPELHYFLVPFIKNFFEISKICQEYAEYSFLTSPNLFKITKLFSNQVSNLFPNEKSSINYLYDSLNFSIKIGKSNYSVRLRQSHIDKLKNFLEKSLKPFLSKNYKIPSNLSTLLVEFDTLRNKTLFETSKNSKLNFVSYNRRRPSIWNRDSFSVIKNSNCSLIDFNQIYDDELKKSIKQGKLEIEIKLNKLWGHQEFFSNFFSINDLSIWEILKPFLIDLTTKRMFEAISEIEITKKVFKLYNFKNVLILSEHGFNEQIIIQIAKQNDIPVILLQHGVFYDTKEALPQNIFAGIMPIKSNLFFTWGEIIKNYSVNSGILSEKIKPLGSIFYDKIFEVKQKKLHLKSDYILLALAWPVKNQINDLTVKTLESYEKCIKELCAIISKQKKKLIIKIHPYSEQEDFTNIIKKINSKIIIIKNGNILNLIQSCELFITLDLSTTILEAQILEKPVISIIVRDVGLGTPSIFENDSCIRIPIEKFQTELDNLSNNDYREKIIQNGNEFVKKYVFEPNASSKIISYLEKS
jgi:hypothetical protein